MSKPHVVANCDCIPTTSRLVADAQFANRLAACAPRN
jgi:hypothetical protein